MNNKIVYVHNAATTHLSPSLIQPMTPYFVTEYGNPSSIYSVGRQARAAVEKARRQVADAIGAQPNEIYFTSGGSEADNWAIKGTAHRLLPKGKKHIITTNFEHHAVLHTTEALKKEGFDITYLPVNSDGLISPKQVADAIREDTALVSIMFANNEIGTIQPVAAIGEVCRQKGVLFHTDAVQAVGHIAIDVNAMNIDMLSLSAHKFHGPKGIGALYVRKGPQPNILIDGGAQEKGRRAGTENVAGIVGLGQAITEACADIPAHTKKVQAMRDKLIDGLSVLPRVRLNGSRTHRLPGNCNLSFEGIEGESLLLMLDASGICASSGSACTSGSLDPSHVLLAIGLPHEIAHGSLRLSIGDTNTMEEVEYILNTVPPIVERLRSMSPVWEKLVK